jgi:hypothetical protein
MSLLDVSAGHADVVLVYAITLLGARQDPGRASLTARVSIRSIDLRMAEGPAQLATLHATPTSHDVRYWPSQLARHVVID